MSSYSEQSKDSGEPDFTLPEYNVVTEENWPELQAKGFAFIRNVPAREAVRAMVGTRSYYEVRKKLQVVAGQAFSEEEGRPLAHMPGVGFYSAPMEDQPPSSTGTGPASS